MALEVLVVNEDRYLVNTDSPNVDSICEGIISTYPCEPVLDWDIVRDSDLDRGRFNNSYPWE
jgi:hypothetical protein